ncbi:MAG TPA: hypothetical protein VMH86_04925 [Rhizomicrobium sp.]|nr:hypothetical protein [Rhizomicrobium sp.]
MRAAFVLLSSPFLGPASWAKVAPYLGDAAIMDYAGAFDTGAPFYPRIVASIARQAPDQECILVAHSGAGALVFLAAAAIGAHVRGAIFADALLPHPGRSWFETISPDFAAHLRSRAMDGLLPRWDRWWRRSELDMELPKVPCAFLEEIAPDAPAISNTAYLQWSDGYAAEAADAQARGWLLMPRALGHLAPLMRPHDVAQELIAAARALRCSPSR